MKSPALLSALAVVIAMMQSPNSHAQAPPRWQDQGGTLVTDPSCVGFGLGEVVCAAVGARGTLIVNRFDGTNWKGFEDLGGVVVRKPSCARWGLLPVLCAVIDTQSRVQVNVYNSATWTGFQLLGGQSISEPACVGTAFIGNFATHCAIIGVNGALQINTFDGTQWSGFKSLGGSYIYNPTCTQDWTFAGVFCAAVTTGARLEGWKNVSGGTGSWVQMPAVGSQVTADPNCSGIGAGKILCAVRSGTRLKVNRADDTSTWPLFTDLGGILMAAPGCMPNLHPLLGTPTATCAVRDTNSAVQMISFDGSTWSGFQLAPGVNTVGSPSCTFVGQTQKLCGVRGTNNHLYTLFL
jgi:hypothetical protein